MDDTLRITDYRSLIATIHLEQPNMDLTPIEQANSLKKELARSRRELSILYDISSAMRTTLDLNHILYIILTGVTSHKGLGFNRAALFLLNHTERCLEPQMAIGPESGEHAQKIWEYISQSTKNIDDLIQEEILDQNIGQGTLYKSIQHLKIPLGGENQNLLLNAYLSGMPLHIGPDKINAHYEDPLLRAFQTSELIIMPLKVKDQVNGLIIADNLYTQKPITDEDFKIFTMLGNQAGLAIENSRLYELTRHQSRTDANTGLWNHGFFQDQLAHELRKAEQERQPLTLLIADVDNFKHLNDIYGHQTGDIALKEMAHILKYSSRDIDYVCRYGGEEFSIILKNLDKQQGYIIAERIRKNIAGYEFAQSTDKTPLKITISIGLASFPDDTSTKEGLIAAADKAMYIAKFSGKNKTVCAKRD